MGLLSSLAIAVGFMLLVGALLALALALANRKLYVFEDPRIGEVEEMLPKSNCGACGNAGCRSFAELAVAGKVALASCTVSSAEQRQAIADYLGVDAGVAAGSENKALRRGTCSCAGHKYHFMQWNLKATCGPAATLRCEHGHSASDFKTV